jgi:hypothetical protein
MEQKQIDNFLFKPTTGNTIAVAAGLSFFFLCMILTFVGPAGSKVPHAGQNKAAFLFILMLTLTLAGFSVYSKMGRRKLDGSPLPYFSIGLCVICILSLITLLFNGFAI